MDTNIWVIPVSIHGYLNILLSILKFHTNTDTKRYQYRYKKSGIFLDAHASQAPGSSHSHSVTHSQRWIFTYLTILTVAMSQTNLRYISTISQPYVSHISAISQPISTISQSYLNHISAKFQ